MDTRTTYKSLRPSEKRAFKKYILYRFKMNGVKTINSKNVCNNKIKILISEWESRFNYNPVEEYVNRNHSKLSTKEGYIYVIENLEHNICKIGFSVNPKKRIKEIQTGCPYFLKILLTFEADRSTEKRLHHKYSKYKMSGEWFKIEGSLKDSIFKHISDNIV